MASLGRCSAAGPEGPGASPGKVWGRVIWAEGAANAKGRGASLGSPRNRKIPQKLVQGLGRGESEERIW